MQDIDVRGIIPAIVTPMTNDGALDLPALRRYAGWLAEQGPVALAVNVVQPTQNWPAKAPHKA